MVGLVTGRCRLGALDIGGNNMNVDALSRMESGLSATEAARQVTEENPGADCGLMCIDVVGRARASLGQPSSKKPGSGAFRPGASTNWCRR